MIHLITLLLLFRTLISIALPTRGYIDRYRLETYEDLSGDSSDFDLFGNLTFKFTCEGKQTGLYADLDYDCKIFHACDESGNGFPVICPENALFDQRERICTDKEEVNCEEADKWFYLNELPYSMETSEDDKTQLEEKEEVPSVLPLLLS